MSQWHEVEDTILLSIIDTPVLIYVEGEIGMGKLTFEPATRKNPTPKWEWQIFYPAHHKPGTVTPTHWAEIEGPK